MADEMDPTAGVSIASLQSLARSTADQAQQVNEQIDSLLNTTTDPTTKQMLMTIMMLAGGVHSLAQQMQGAAYVLDELYGN